MTAFVIVLSAVWLLVVAWLASVAFTASRRAYDHAHAAAAHAAESYRHANRANEKAGDAAEFAVKAAAHSRQAVKAAAHCLRTEGLADPRTEAVPTDARPLDSMTIVSDTGPPTVRLPAVPMVGLSEADDASDLPW